jgi:hypothetical protein
MNVMGGIFKRLGLPSPRECGTRFFREAAFGSTTFAVAMGLFDIPVIIAYFIVWLTCGEDFSNGGFLAILFCLLVWLSPYYDWDAVQCFMNKKSSYYRSTGVTKKDLWEDKGLMGEFNAAVVSQKLTMPHKILYNVCVPMPNGNYQEIDAVIISEKAIYVLECKNRQGTFVGNIEGKTWVQKIGDQENETHNIYQQNQEHIYALEYFLKSKGLMEMGHAICGNLVLTNGDFTLEMDGGELPVNFACGDNILIAKFVQKLEAVQDEREDKLFMNKVYMALLPYSLNTKEKRENMLITRQTRSMNKEFDRKSYKYYHFPNGIPGVWDDETILRRDEVYTQLSYKMEGSSYTYWVTRPDLAYVERKD